MCRARPRAATAEGACTAHGAATRGEKAAAALRTAREHMARALQLEQISGADSTHHLIEKNHAYTRAELETVHNMIEQMQQTMHAQHDQVMMILQELAAGS